MPPRKQFSKEQIVEAAFEIAKVDGISGLTVRKVASKLGSSVAPIYVNFKDAAELKDAVVQRVFALGRQMLSKRYTGDRLLDIGIAGVKFAREYSVLFRELMLTNNPYMDEYEPSLGDDVLREMAGTSELEGFSEEELMTMFLKLRIFQTGLSTMVANNLLPDELDEEAEIELLATIGEDILAAAHWRKSGAPVGATGREQGSPDEPWQPLSGEEQR